MRQIIISILIPLISFVTLSQQVDTIIKTKAYSSYYSFKYKTPVIVVYTLYKGGGDCNRDKFHFKVASLKKGATSEDYSCSGYDMGHLANAEDFAYDCSLDELTFRFWNCLPQTPQLNRGIWNVNEAEIRKLSQSDSLLIICGGFFKNFFIGDSVYVPSTCFKVVYSYTQKNVVMSLIFTNTSTPEKMFIDYDSLNLTITKKYKINLNKLIKNNFYK